MDGPRFARPTPPHTPLVTRRRALRLAGGGLAALALGTHAVPGRLGAAPAAQEGIPADIGNPAGRVLLPGEAGLDGFDLDFTLTGPPSVFFAPVDTPGWSPDLSAAVGGFAFGYAATLAKAPRRDRASDRAVQVCVHHGFPSAADADVAWISLTASLAGGASNVERGEVREIDVVEIFEVDGRRTSIMATVGADRFDAVVVALRAAGTLVTVAIADFAGKRPTLDEAHELAEAEGKKLKHGPDGGSDLAAAFYRRWTPGFAFAGLGGAPFSAWPAVLGGAAVPITGETATTAEQRRQFARSVQYQSHVEGPFLESLPTFEGHTLFYSGQTSYFDGAKQARSYQAETAERLSAGLPGLALTKDAATKSERRYAYQTPSSYGTLSGLMLNRLVIDGDHPLSIALHILAVPNNPGAAVPSVDQVQERLRSVIRSMRSGLEDCLGAPQRAPLTIAVATP